MPMRLFFISVLSLIVFNGCQTQSKNNQDTPTPSILETGVWRATLDLNGTDLPFNLEIIEEAGKLRAVVINQNERIEIESLSITTDSINFELPFFPSEIKARIDSPGLISGVWINHSRENYRIPFTAESNKDFRFTPTKSSIEIKDRYHVVFDETSDEPWNAVLEIENKEGHIFGTFLTETGDYRYLEGNLMNDGVYLSTFDGSHAFLFSADIVGDSLINGKFLSGTHYKTSWVGVQSDSFELQKPENLTFLKDDYAYFDFKLPNQDGDTVTWEDLSLTNKVVIVDIMGSWCPNCMDASKAIHQLTKPFEDDIQILPIAFEATEDLAIAKKRVLKMNQDLGIPNEKFLFGGKANKSRAAEAFPMLNHIMSFPTLIFIDKNRNVRQIYTGFYGPGTGSHYEEFMKKTEALLREMVAEKA